MTSIIIKTKTELHDTITSIDNFDAVLEYDPITKTFKLIVNGVFKDGGNMPKSGLTEADKEWIAGLIRPINYRLTNIENHVESIDNRLTNVENRLEAIENCPTIKKELKK